MIEWAAVVAKGKSIHFNKPCMKAALLAPFSIPIVGLVFSLIQPMPNQPITTSAVALEYLGLFSIGALVIGFPLGLIYGYPVLRITSRLRSTPSGRFAATLGFSLFPAVLILMIIQEWNYFTSLCFAMSLITAVCAQLLLFRLEAIDRSAVQFDDYYFRG